MPNLDFYAVDDDQTAVLSALFELGLFRVFEAYSRPGCGLREFATPAEIPADPHGPFLRLFAHESGPEPTVARIDLRSDPRTDATFRYHCIGWGLIGLRFGNLFREDELRWSNTNHNTEKRALRWAEGASDLGDSAAWDWPAVAKASGRLNRIIRAMAVRKIGSHPVLPQAAQLITRAGLHHEYGTGIHPTPPPGMTRPHRNSSSQIAVSRPMEPHAEQSTGIAVGALDERMPKVVARSKEPGRDTTEAPDTHCQ